MDTLLGNRISSPPALLHHNSQRFVPHHGPEILHGHEAYKELIVVLVLGHVLLVAVLYWLFTSSQKQTIKRRQVRSQTQATKARRAMSAKLALV